MKAIVTVKELKEHMSRMNSFVEKGKFCAFPVLENAYIQVKDETHASITVGNVSNGIKYVGKLQITGGIEGECLVNYATLKKALKGKTMTIESEGDKVKLNSSSFKTDKTADWHTVAMKALTFNGDEICSMNITIDSHLHSKTVKACCEDELRIQMNGVCIDNGEQIAVASDGKILSVAPVKFHGAVPDGNVILQKKVFSALIGVGKVSVQRFASEKPFCCFKTPTFSITARDIDGRYPNWRSVIPFGIEECHVKVADTKKFMDAVKTVSESAPKSTHGINLIVTAGSNEMQVYGCDVDFDCSCLLTVDLATPAKVNNILYLSCTYLNFLSEDWDGDIWIGRDECHASIFSNATAKGLTLIMPLLIDDMVVSKVLGVDYGVWKQQAPLTADYHSVDIYPVKDKQETTEVKEEPVKNEESDTLYYPEYDLTLTAEEKANLDAGTHYYNFEKAKVMKCKEGKAIPADSLVPDAVGEIVEIPAAEVNPSEFFLLADTPDEEKFLMAHRPDFTAVEHSTPHGTVFYRIKDDVIMMDVMLNLNGQGYNYSFCHDTKNDDRYCERLDPQGKRLTLEWEQCLELIELVNKVKAA